MILARTRTVSWRQSIPIPRSPALLPCPEIAPVFRKPASRRRDLRSRHLLLLLLPRMRSQLARPLPLPSRRLHMKHLSIFPAPTVKPNPSVSISLSPPREPFSAPRNPKTKKKNPPSKQANDRPTLLPPPAPLQRPGQRILPRRTRILHQLQQRAVAAQIEVVPQLARLRAAVGVEGRV